MAGKLKRIGSKRDNLLAGHSSDYRVRCAQTYKASDCVLDFPASRRLIGIASTRRPRHGLNRTASGRVGDTRGRHA
jgi:hypothetical protein